MMTLSKRYRVLVAFSFCCIIPMFSQIIEDMSETDRRVILKDRVRERANSFLTSLELIGRKTTPSNIKEANLEIAKSYFVSNATIEVSNVRTGETNTFPAPAYLERLRLLDYSKIKIEADLRYLSDLEKVSKSVYESTGIYEQEFKGYVGEVLAYDDITTKKMFILVQEVQDNWTSTPFWDIKFVKITVLNTRR